MQESIIIEAQLDFYRKGGAGCLFAAHAAKDPTTFEWRLSICDVDMNQVKSLVQSAIMSVDISTQSILFPSVIKAADLKNLLTLLRNSGILLLEQEEEFQESMCLGFRLPVGKEKSYVTGFGGFDFLPKTRRSVFTEITFRTKPRPAYKYMMKESPEGVIHLADMDMKGMSENKFKSLWYGSLDRTEEIIGHKPDLRSAAKERMLSFMNGM